MPVDALAGHTGIPAPRLVRLLRALGSVGVFGTTPEDVVPTPCSRLLRRDAESTAPFVGIHLDRGYAAWTDLLVSLRSGRPWMDLHMLVVLGGRERTEAQWRQLLRDGGWVVERHEGTRAAVARAS